MINKERILTTPSARYIVYSAVVLFTTGEYMASYVLYKLFRFILEIKRILRNTYWWLWFHVWIDENEFHPSLNPDVDKMVKMSQEEQRRYMSEICYKRSKAHQMDFGKKYKIREKATIASLIMIVSLVFAMCFSLVFHLLGMREGISLVFIGSMIISIIILYSRMKKTECCPCKTKSGG